MNDKVDLVPITSVDEFEIGKPLPWPIYNEDRMVLLRAGVRITTLDQARQLVERGLFRENISVNKSENQTQGKSDYSNKNQQNPFLQIDAIAERLESIFAALQEYSAAAVPLILEIAEEIQVLVVTDADAAIGAVHRQYNYPYSLLQPIYTAILSDLIATRVGFDSDARRTILAATLTANIATEKIQDKLNKQAQKFTEKARKIIQKHPQQSVNILQKAGVIDGRWLAIVLRHHERPDGSGYPDGLSFDKIPREAKVISIADIYLAMTTQRGYRSAKNATDVLRELFAENKKNDHDLYLSFIKELTIYPPGTYVKLENGEIGMVVKRNPESAATPFVQSLVSVSGDLYSQPIMRHCKEPGFAIQGVCAPDNVPLNMSLLWGYA